MNFKTTFKKFIFPIVLLLVAAVIHQYFQSYSDSKIDALNKKSNQLKTKINYINKQLNEFYYPLKHAVHKSKVLWTDYKEHYGNKMALSRLDAKAVDEKSLKWQKYMVTLFKPLHTQLSAIVENKRNLAKKAKLINVQLDLLYKHIAYYKIIFSQWNEDDFSERFAPTHFPYKLEEVLEKDISTLLKEREVLEQML